MRVEHESRFHLQEGGMFGSVGWGRRGSLVAVALTLVGACSEDSGTDGGVSPATTAAADAGVEVQRARLTASVGSTRFDVREHFLAGGEMQISGEPFAEAMGR